MSDRLEQARNACLNSSADEDTQNALMLLIGWAIDREREATPYLEQQRGEA